MNSFDRQHFQSEASDPRCAAVRAAIVEAMGSAVTMRSDQRYQGWSYTAWVDDNTARMSRGFDASTPYVALTGLLTALAQDYPERFVPALAVAAE